MSELYPKKFYPEDPTLGKEPKLRLVKKPKYKELEMSDEQAQILTIKDKNALLNSITPIAEHPIYLIELIHNTERKVIAKLHELNYYQLPPELVEKLKDDCPQCHGKGNVVYLGSIDILPCPKCKGKKKVGEPHLERLVVLDDNQDLPKGLTAKLNLPNLHHYLYDGEALKEANFKRIKE